MITILSSKIVAEITTLIVLILSAGLSVTITMRYVKSRRTNLLFWSSGLWVFTAGVLLELAFAAGIYSALLGRVYLFLVAVLVELLALGSIQFARSITVKRAYYLFVLVSTLFIAYSLASTNIGNIIVNYIVAGVIPITIVIASSLITFPAAIILVLFAYKSYRVTKNRRLLSIIAGVVVVSVAGGLYIVQYPAFLYIAELIGIAMLWYGFV